MLVMCDIKTLIASIYNNNNNFTSVDMLWIELCENIKFLFFRKTIRKIERICISL